MKKISFSFKNHFLHRIAYYVLACLVIPSIVTYGVILKTNPKEEEIFSIFIESNIKDSKSFESFIRLNTNSKNKEINVYSSLSSLKTYPVIFQTQGLESDLLILSSEAFKADYSSDFIELESSNKYYGDSNKIVEDKHFGIELFNGKNGYLTSFLSYKEDVKYYAFINKNSVHSLGFNKEGKTNQIELLLEAINNEK